MSEISTVSLPDRTGQVPGYQSQVTPLLVWDVPIGGEWVQVQTLDQSQGRGKDEEGPHSFEGICWSDDRVRQRLILY